MATTTLLNFFAHLANAFLALSGMASQTLVYGTWMVPKKNDGGFVSISHKNDPPFDAVVVELLLLAVECWES